MKHYNKFYINGTWVPSDSTSIKEVINPSTQEVIAQVSLGKKSDVDQAVTASRNAFVSWSQTSREERLAVLDRIIAVYKTRLEDMAQAITAEMGAAISMSRSAQSPIGMLHFITARDVLADFSFENELGDSHIVKEPIGVCGFITPWNWPMNQIACKVAPALACGCTIVLKPSEMTPLSAQLFAEILHEAGVPAGVFNMVYGDGPEVGSAISSHPDIDMVSLTGSTRAGVQVSKAAADNIKRVSLELGGKSPFVILDDADFEGAVRWGAKQCFRNVGQSCNAPTRMLVPAALHDQAVQLVKETALNTRVGDPLSEDTDIGPLSNALQFDKVNGMIQNAVDAGNELIVGGTGRPDGLDKGYFIRPTAFANVRNDSTIAQEEVFGPVLCIIPYHSEEEAIQIANDTPYGLAAYIESGSLERARSVARKMRAGTVYLNRNDFDPRAPFGGYKQSGNGREWGEFGFHDFLEIKGIVGYQ
ncbi:aldehyde dehydrogenase family protein [Marinomonas spartinae]|uniref:aldehyde dehydrogenase family protein n=1 Tax=Marinomonas spartinae TaxID=1792290 RepID=UPI0018F12312|nr:aldehyde dehydrogenase family protein [Marinomonas spartinae]MBJ7556854.1 aldehyde dehydrogenase family protein [Marinomonas spartinae]